MGTGVRVVRSADITFSGCSILDEHPEGQPSGASLLELVESQRINVSGCQLLDGMPCGLDATDCSHVVVTGCTISESRPQPVSRHAVRFAGAGTGNLIGMSSIGPAVESPLSLAVSAGVVVQGNVLAADD